MPATQKKTGTGKAKPTSAKGKAAPKSGSQSTTKRKTKPPKKPPIYREVGAVICLLLAIFSALGYFNPQAIFINGLATLEKGLFGFGFWLMPVMLLLISVKLFRHFGRPVRLQIVLCLLVPLFVGAAVHTALCEGDYALKTSVLPALWESGAALSSGGALSGMLSVLLTKVFSSVGAMILLLLGLLCCVLGLRRIGPTELVHMLNEYRAQRYREKKKKAKKGEEPEKKSNLQITDEGVVAVQQFNLEIADKEFIVLVGPSGCGKSTTLRMIAGLEDISGGELYIGGKLMNDVEPKDRDIAMVFQSYALYPHMTVYGNMAFSLKLKKVPKDEIDRRVRQAAEILDITQYLDRKPKALSGGQRQRVAIGRAIVRDPAVFLMDEPLSNLDAKLRNQMRAELIKLRERIDTTFIYVTHDQTEAMTLGDRIVIMKDGFIQQIGTPQEVFDHPANLFVAGFIGTPQMNLFDAHLARRDGKYTVTVGSVTVELSEEKQQRLAAKDVAEQDVVLGVRPDHIMLCADGVKGKVDVSEMMGSSVHLHVAAEGKDVIVIVPTNGAAAHFPAGSEVNMIFGGNVAHVFSKETEKNLEW